MGARTILAVVDPRATEEQPVLERAAWLAARAGADLELFACEYDSDIDAGHVATVWIPEAGARERLLLQHRQRLEELAKPLRARGLSVTVDVAWDYPLGEAVLRKVAARSPWLVAKDTFHHNIVQRTLLSNSDWHLIRNCPVPLLLVKQRKIADRPSVFAAVDPLHEHDKPAELDDAIVRFAEALARSARGELHVVHSFAPPMGLQLPPEVVKLIENQHREAMAGFLRAHRVPAGNVHLIEGLAHECLQVTADKHRADFMIMGAVARRGLRKLCIGSTAERTLDRLPCDLVIIKAPGFKALSADAR